MPRKYQLETIPVWTSLERNTECFLCDLEDESERRNTEFFLGNSIMAPEMRVRLNEHGFCPRHLHLLGEGSGKLGLSLALATHIDSLATRVLKLGRVLEKTDRRKSKRWVDDFCEAVVGQEKDCLMCERIAHNLSNYVYTLIKLWQTDREFAVAFEESRGICLHHLPLVVRMGAELLDQGAAADWNRTILGGINRQLRRLSDELEQFTWQFDAASDLQTPEAVMDAVPRAIRKIAGFGPDRLP